MASILDEVLSADDGVEAETHSSVVLFGPACSGKRELLRRSAWEVGCPLVSAESTPSSKRAVEFAAFAKSAPSDAVATAPTGLRGGGEVARASVDPGKPAALRPFASGSARAENSQDGVVGQPMVQAWLVSDPVFAVEAATAAVRAVQDRASPASASATRAVQQVAFSLVLSCRRPWALLSALERWTRVLELAEAAVRGLLSSPDSVAECQTALARLHHQGLDAHHAVSAEADGLAAASDSTDVELGPESSSLPLERVVPRVLVLTQAELLDSAAASTPGLGSSTGSTVAARDAAAARTLAPPQVAFLLARVRDWCLQHGFALVLTSAADGRNVGRWLQWVLRATDAPAFAGRARLWLRPSFVPASRLFVPAGVDSTTLIQLSATALPDTWRSVAPLDVIPCPPHVLARQAALQQLRAAALRAAGGSFVGGAGGGAGSAGAAGADSSRGSFWLSSSAETDVAWAEDRFGDEDGGREGERKTSEGAGSSPSLMTTGLTSTGVNLDASGAYWVAAVLAHREAALPGTSGSSALPPSLAPTTLNTLIRSAVEKAHGLTQAKLERDLAASRTTTAPASPTATPTPGSRMRAVGLPAPAVGALHSEWDPALLASVQAWRHAVEGQGVEGSGDGGGGSGSGSMSMTLQGAGLRGRGVPGLADGGGERREEEADECAAERDAPELESDLVWLTSLRRLSESGRAGSPSASAPTTDPSTSLSRQVLQAAESMLHRAITESGSEASSGVGAGGTASGAASTTPVVSAAATDGGDGKGGAATTVGATTTRARSGSNASDGGRSSGPAAGLRRVGSRSAATMGASDTPPEGEEGGVGTRLRSQVRPPRIPPTASSAAPAEGGTGTPSSTGESAATPSTEGVAVTPSAKDIAGDAEATAAFFQNLLKKPKGTKATRKAATKTDESEEGGGGGSGGGGGGVGGSEGGAT